MAAGDALRAVLNRMASNPDAHAILSEGEVAKLMVVTNGTIMARGRLYDIITTEVSPGIEKLTLKLSNPESLGPTERKDGLTVNVTRDGTWLTFTASDGKSATLRIETLAEKRPSPSIVGAALRQWCQDRQEEAHGARQYEDGPATQAE